MLDVINKVLSTTVDGIKHTVCFGSPMSNLMPYVNVSCEAIETLAMVRAMGVAEDAGQLVAATTVTLHNINTMSGSGVECVAHIFGHTGRMVVLVQVSTCGAGEVATI